MKYLIVFFTFPLSKPVRLFFIRTKTSRTKIKINISKGDVMSTKRKKESDCRRRHFISSHRHALPTARISVNLYYRLQSYVSRFDAFIVPASPGTFHTHLPTHLHNVTTWSGSVSKRAGSEKLLMTLPDLSYTCMPSYTMAKGVLRIVSGIRSASSRGSGQQEVRKIS